MRLILEAEGYKATVCPAGEEAHEVIAREQPEVIVVDTWLQIRDAGWELVQILRLDAATKHIPIIIATSDSEHLEDYASKASALRNVLLIPKPFDEETLIRAIRRVTAPGNVWDSHAQAALDTPPDDSSPK
jgi:CheY-like chemotaxis protein